MTCFLRLSIVLRKLEHQTGTNEGVYRIHRFTAIEQMQQALSTCPVSLEPTASGGNNRLTDMFMMYGYDEACAMCLMIACTQDDVQLARNAAAYAGLRHDNSRRARTRRERQGADFPVELVAQASKAGMSPAERVRRCASDALIVFGGKCRISDRPNRSTMMMRRTNDLNGGGRVSSFGVYETIHSYRYNGLVTYAARLLRPFWMHTIAIVPSSSSAGTNNKFLRECRFNSDELVLLQEPIRRLCEFMESSHFASAVKMDPSALYVVVFVFERCVLAWKCENLPSRIARLYHTRTPTNTQTHTHTNRYNRRQRDNKENDEDISVQGRLFGDYLPSHPDSRVASEQKAKLIEQRKVHFLHHLLVKAKEVLALFRILLTPNGALSHPSKSLNGTISKLSDRQRQNCVNALTQRTWAYLVTQHAGKELLNELVEATIRSQTAQMAERMARRLTSECGSFYSPIEQRLLRVEERLKFSKESEVKTSRSQALVESEQTLIEAGKRLRERLRKHSNEEPSQMLESVVSQYMRKLEIACDT